MDYDNDGTLDFISGSYDPGDVYLFRGLGDGEYAKMETILDANGQPLVHHPVEFAKYMEMKEDPDVDQDESIQMRVASFGSWPATVDWEADGDLDMLIGSFGGSLFLRKNIGSRSKPEFDGKSIPVHVDGAPLKENCHACPVVADWDGDGLWDLVVGSGDGSVGWYKNLGSPSKADFRARKQLVAPAGDSKFLEQNLGPNDEPVPGVRAQICVTDYNQDGLLDLIVGDYSDINWTRDLNEDEQAQFALLVDKKQKSISEITALRKIMIADDNDESEKAEAKEKYQKVVQAYSELEEQTKSFYKDSRRASFIWLYLRRPGKALDRPKDRAKTDNVGTAPGDATIPSTIVHHFACGT